VPEDTDDKEGYKRALIFVAAGFVILATIGIAFVIQKKSLSTLFFPPASTTPSIIIQSENTGSCDTPRFRDVGTKPSNKDLLIYTTECQRIVYPNNSRDIVYRFYVRDAEGTFNRLLYTSDNKVDWQGTSYGMLISPQKNILAISRATGPDSTAFVDLNGEDAAAVLTEAMKDIHKKEVQTSPHSRFLALDHKESTKIDVQDTTTHTVKTYDFPETRLNGTYVAGWSPDDKKMYIAGGIWEFSAPARLWEVTLATGGVKEMPGLEDFSYPVRVYPEEGIAYLVKYDRDDENIRSSHLYEYDLVSGSTRPIANADTATFSPLVKIGNAVWYPEVEYLKSEKDPEQLIDQWSLKIRDLSTGAVQTHIAQPVFDGLSESEKWIVVFKPISEDAGSYRILFPEQNREVLIGETSAGSTGYRPPLVGREYVSAIVGVSEHNSK